MKKRFKLARVSVISNVQFKKNFTFAANHLTQKTETYPFLNVKFVQVQ